MEQIASGAAVPASPTGRVVSEAELQAILKGLRLARQVINKMEEMVEDMYLNRIGIPIDKKVIIKE